MNNKPLLISAGQLVDGRGGPPVADAGVLVDATGVISWAGPMARAPHLPGQSWSRPDLPLGAHPAHGRVARRRRKA